MVDICSQSSHFSCLEIKKDPGINFIKIDQTKSSLPIKLGDSSWFPSPSIPIETRRTCSEILASFTFGGIEGCFVPVKSTS